MEETYVCTSKCWEGARKVAKIRQAGEEDGGLWQGSWQGWRDTDVKTQVDSPVLALVRLTFLLNQERGAEEGLGTDVFYWDLF